MNFSTSYTKVLCIMAGAITAAKPMDKTVVNAADESERGRVVRSSELPGARSYQQWSAEWWKWAWSIPAFANPIGPWVGTTPQPSYPKGYDCGMGQDPQSPVFFLAGTPLTTAERECEVPAGKMIFFPILNLGNEYPCPLPNFGPGPGQSMEQFLTIGYGPFLGARQYLDHPDPLHATLDGSPLVPAALAKPPWENPYRATSPLFRVRIDPTLATLNWDPCIVPGTEQPAVSDGYWIMLRPLSRGRHTLSFSSGSLDVTFHLEVRIR